MSSRLGFEIKTAGSGGDFLPIIKYDARAGIFTRIDREDRGNGFESVPTVIENEHFKAQFDLANAETGWIDFATGTIPSFVLVRMSSLTSGGVMPVQPTERHKNGIRVMIKLASDIADGTPRIREFAGNSIALMLAFAGLFEQYDAGLSANPGMLPVVVLDGRPIPVKSGSGQKTSTNYHPRFKIVSWAPRGDLAPRPDSHPAGNGHAAPQVAPATGARPAAPPAAKPKPVADASDFG
jgi:hypothetical protein